MHKKPAHNEPTSIPIIIIYFLILSIIDLSNFPSIDAFSIHNKNESTVLLILFKSLPIAMNSDLEVLYHPKHYFTVIALSYEMLQIRSNNTNHFWLIKPCVDGYIVFHKHQVKHSYHMRSAATTLLECFLEIISHYEYQLQGRKHKAVTEKTFFDEVVRI